MEEKEKGDKEKRMKLSIVICTMDRNKELKELLENLTKQTFKDFEVILVNNGRKLDFNIYDYLLDYRCIIFNGWNIGSPEGRNKGIQRAEGDYVIFIDDDAEFEDTNSLQKIVNRMDSDPMIGLLMARVKNYKTRESYKYEFPFPDLSFVDRTFNIGYFVGCCHVVRREIIKDFRYDPNLKKEYGSEELDLGYHIIKKGYRMVYTPEVVVLHKKATTGRLPSEQVFLASMYSRGYLARKYLPYPYRFVYVCSWSLFCVKMGKFKGISSLLSGWKRYNQKDLLDKNDIYYLKKTKGRLWK